MQKWYYKESVGLMAALGLLFLMLVVTSLAAWNSFELHKQAIDVEFRASTSAIENKLRQRLLAYEHLLRSGVGFFRASNGVSREQWREFVDTLNLKEHYRGIQGIGYTQWLKPEGVPVLERQIRAEGFEDFRVWPEGKREYYSAILYLEPFDWRNQRAFGYDMYSDPVRQQAMSRAWRTGQAAASAAVTLVQETERHRQVGFLMYLPVYQEASNELRGFVYSPFRMVDLMEGILGQRQQLDVRLEIVDWVGGEAGRVMYESAPASGAGHQALLEPKGEHFFQFANHTWLLRFDALPAFSKTVSSREPWFILIGGISLSVLSTAVFWLFWRARSHAAALAESNRQLKEFAYVASHDLQEPLRKVSIYTQLLVEEFSQGDRVNLDEYAEVIRSGVQRMQALISDLLEYSRIIHHSFEQDASSADLNVALAEVKMVLEPVLREQAAVLEEEKLPTVRADQAQIGLVFQNLLANALKYQRDGNRPHIRIRAQRSGGNWVISVQDNGIGFSPEYAEKIFGLFKRLFKDEYPGTGLGLAICKRIVERYQGRIWASSEGKDTGATFFFSLPAIED